MKRENTILTELQQNQTVLAKPYIISKLFSPQISLCFLYIRALSFCILLYLCAIVAELFDIA